jgi:hypothetical protein
MSRTWSAVCALTIAASVTTAETQSQALREWAKAHAARSSAGEPMRLVGPVGDYKPRTIGQLTREAEAAFRGRLFRLETYIGSDGERLLTDYAIRQHQLLAGRSQSAVARANDFTKPLILTALGGELTIEGVQVISAPAGQQPIKDGGEYIVFVMPSRGGRDRYEVYGAGIFEVEDERLKPLHVDGERLFEDAFHAPLAPVLARIQEMRLF